jgi:hypothetical protein
MKTTYIASLVFTALTVLASFGCNGEIAVTEEFTQMDPGAPGVLWCASEQGKSELCPNGFTVNVYGKDLTTARAVVRATYFWQYAGAPEMSIVVIQDRERPSAEELELRKDCTFAAFTVPEDEIKGLGGWAEWLPAGPKGSSACQLKISASVEGSHKEIIATHELGHCLGLGHVQDSTDVMSLAAGAGKFDFAVSYYDGQEIQKRYNSKCVP